MKVLLVVISAAALLCVAFNCQAQEVRVNTPYSSISVGVPGGAVAVDVGTHGRTSLVYCGLFGRPSKRELMGQMIAAQQEHIAIHRHHVEISRETNATLHRLEVANARQEEILRNIDRNTQRAADAGQRAAESSAKAAEAGQDLSKHMIDRALRDYKPQPSDAPGDIRGLPDRVTAPDLRTLKKQPSDAPGDLRSLPDVESPGSISILQGTNGRAFYVKGRTVPPQMKPQANGRFTSGFSLRN